MQVYNVYLHEFEEDEGQLQGSYPTEQEAHKKIRELHDNSPCDDMGNWLVSVRVESR